LPAVGGGATAMFENVPTKWAERRSRLLQIGLVGLSLGVPCVFCAATFPGARAPYVLGGVAAGLTLVGLVCAFWGLRADPELLFGCLTTFAALMTVATFVSVFARQQVENESAWTFLAMAALSVVALSLIAHDWARRQLLIAAAIAAAVLGLFVIRVGFESLNVPPQWERDQIAARALAEEDFMATAQTDHSTLDQAICVVQGRDCAGGNDTITSNSSWVEAEHELDVQLAAYRVAVTGTSADQAALKAVLAQPPQIDEDISVLTAIENGPDALWRSAYHSAGPALVPGPLGWIVFGALLLGLLGYWLKINARQLAGPVDVQAANGSDRDKELNTVLRVAVLQNVPEPGASPGSPSANPVTTLLDIAGGPLTPVSKLVQTVLTVLGRRYGYQVSVDVAADASGAGNAASAAPVTPAPDRTTVLIRVKSVSSGTTLASRVFTTASDEETVRTAGLWAAGFILDRSSRIPSWAAWNAETAHALVAADNSPAIPDLEAALREAPNSGILLVLLGHGYELAGRRSEAINCYARAVTAHPRYLVARYRLAAAVAVLRTKPERDDQRLDDLRALNPAIAAMNVKVDCSLGDLVKEGSLKNWYERTDFGGLAITLLKRLHYDMRYHYRLVNAMRRSERDSMWAGLAWNFSTLASRFRKVVKSARLALEADELEKLRKMAAKPDSWWQISYNAACGHATHHCNVTALALLEQTLVRPEVHQLSAEWVRKDPDLESVATSPRYRRFLAQLGSGD
jgi:tetratricopeptide (TPR) repeat protein